MSRNQMFVYLLDLVIYPAVKPSRTPARVDLPFVVYYNQSDNTLEISSEESVLLDCSIHNEDNNQVILSSLLPVDSVNDCVISLNFLESDVTTQHPQPELAVMLKLKQ